MFTLTRGVLCGVIDIMNIQIIYKLKYLNNTIFTKHEECKTADYSMWHRANRLVNHWQRCGSRRLDLWPAR